MALYPAPSRWEGKECVGHWSCHRAQVLFLTHALTKDFIQNMYRLLQLNSKEHTEVGPFEIGQKS